MIGILIMAHDRLGDSLADAVTHVLGARPPQFDVFPVAATDDPIALLPKARGAVAALDDGDGVAIFCDIYGATPCNLAAGGIGVARELSPHDREIALALAKPLWDAGLLVVGIDVIGAYLTEVNVTSPTCFVEITQQSGFDVGGLFADALLRACAAA